MKYSRSKKADLSLSTNAIVILILAITILGLALTFVRGLFGKAGGLIESAGDIQISNPPTRDNPMMISPSNLKVRQSEVGQIIIAYLNTKPSTVSCTLDNPEPSTTKFQVSTTAASIEPDQYKVWKASYKHDATITDPQTAIYTFEVSGTDCVGSQDLIVTVNP